MSGEIELNAMVRAWWRRRYVMAAIVAVVFVAGLIYISVATPIYSVTVRAAPATEAPQLRGQLGVLGAALGGIGGNMFAQGGGVSLEEATVIMTSREFTERFLVDNDLLPALYAERYDAAAGEWVEPPPSLWGAFRFFHREVATIGPGPGGMLNVTVDWEDADLAAAWANALVRQLDDQLRERALRNARENISFLNRQIDEVSSVEIRQAFYRLLEDELKAEMLANSREEYAFRLVDRAFPPGTPAYPRRTLVMIGSLLLGFVLTLLYAVIAIWISNLRLEDEAAGAGA
jgi:capsular polysaccharide biosynthesis protein